MNPCTTQTHSSLLQRQVHPGAGPRHRGVVAGQDKLRRVARAAPAAGICTGGGAPPQQRRAQQRCQHQVGRAVAQQHAVRLCAAEPPPGHAAAVSNRKGRAVAAARLLATSEHVVNLQRLQCWCLVAYHQCCCKHVHDTACNLGICQNCRRGCPTPCGAWQNWAQS